MADEALVYDNFYSPENRLFYAKQPYKSLNPQDHEIRLLKLLPPDDDGILSFTLLDNVPLASVDNRFTALSYCAGKPRNTSRVLVNGLGFNVFANLGHAIREILTYWKKGEVVIEQQLLWIDQICIDQSNPRERTHQVEIMRNIYAGAEKVLVCLAVRECSGLGLQFVIGLREALRGFPAEDACLRIDGTLGSSYFAYDRAMSSYIESYRKSRTWQEGAADFCRLLESSWWSRCWVCQEFIVARNAEFLYGGISINWKDYAIFVHHLMSDGGYSTLYPFHEGAKAKYSLMVIQRSLLDQKHNLNQLGETRTGDLKFWLNYGRGCKSSDARDKIFAFLGLASEEYNINPDYTSSTTIEEVLIQVATRIIAVDKSLDLLSYSAPDQRVSARFNGLPTWVPDWSRLTMHLYPAPAHAKSFSPTPPRIEDGIKLMAEGYRLDYLDSNLKMAFRTTEGPEQDPCMDFRDWWRLHENDGLWYFPYSPLLFILNKVNSHWLLVQNIPENWERIRTDLGLYQKKLFEMARTGDIAWLLEQGLKREIIEIR